MHTAKKATPLIQQMFQTPDAVRNDTEKAEILTLTINEWWQFQTWYLGWSYVAHPMATNPSEIITSEDLMVTTRVLLKCKCMFHSLQNIP